MPGKGFLLPGTFTTLPPGTTVQTPYFPRVHDYVGLWAMEPRAFAAALELIQTTDLSRHVEAGSPPLKSAIELQPAKGGKSIAVIKVMGTMMKQQSSLSEGTSTVQLRRDIRTAAANPDVSAILIAFDSPGGTVAGTDDLANEVRNAAKQKPVWAHVDDLCASAAYWVASQCDQIFANSNTALIGSIGTLMNVYDVSGMAEKQGVKALVFATGPLKGAGSPGAPVSEEQAAYFQSLVDQTQQSFDQGVRKGRGLTDKQLADVRTGGVFMASEALDRKLIDGVRSLDQTMNELIRSTKARTQPTASDGYSYLSGRLDHAIFLQGGTPPVLQGVTAMFETWLQARGFTIESLSDAQMAFFKGVFQQEQRAAATPPTPTVDIAAQAAEQARRVAKLSVICSKQGNPDIEIVNAQGGKETHPLLAYALENNWSEEKTELEAFKAGANRLDKLRNSRPAGPAIISHSYEKDCSLEAIQGAMILRAGKRLDHPALSSPQALAMNVPGWLRAGINEEGRQRAMEAAHRYRSMSMVDLCREAVRLDGRDVPFDRNEAIQAAFSGSSLTNIFTTNVNTIMLMTYMESGDTTLPWTREVDVADYKLNERPRLTKGGALKKLPSGGTADHTSRSDTGESYKVARYALQFQVDEIDVINDTFNALSDIPVEMGRAAARLRPDLVYAILLANPTLTQTGRELFNTTDGNLKTTAALSASYLRAAIAAMRLFQENGVNLGLQPTHLLVPESLRHVAIELTKSLVIQIAGTAGSVTERGSTNAIVNDGLTPVSEPRLENGVIDPDSGNTYSGSATTWFLVSNNANTVEVGFIRGTGRVPQVRSGSLDKGKFGTWFDVSHSIGAKAMDWRGLEKNTA